MHSHFFALALAALWSVAGCGYTTGLTAPASPAHDAPTISVPLLTNQTDEPQMGQIVTERLKRQLLSSGPWRLVNTKDEPELTLTGHVVGLELTPVSFDADNRVTEYHLEVRVELALTRRHDGTVLWSGNALVGDADYYVNDDIAATQRSKERSMRDAGQRIAEQASHSVRLALSEGAHSSP